MSENKMAAHVGREQGFEALGRQWRLGRQTRAVWWEFLEWARGQIPDPITEAKRAVEGMSESVVVKIVSKALDDKRIFLSVASPEVKALLNSLEGGVYLLTLLLKINHPEITEDLAFDISLEVGQERLQELFMVAAGQQPSGNADAPARR